MNLVATHYNCTSPMDYISHHALHSHIPIHHYTNHTAVTIHSLALIVSPHLHLIHTHTFKQHSHMHSPRSLVLAPADISEHFPCILLPVPGARRVRSRACSVPGARRVRSRARSVPGARRVHSRARSVPGARRVRSRARSVPGARRVRSRARSVPGARRVRSRARSLPGPSQSPLQRPLWSAGLACRTSSSSFILGLAVGGRVAFPPLQSVLSPPAGRVCGDTVGSPLQRSDPVLATCQSSTSHSINPGKDAKGSPSWRRVPLLPGLLDTPSQVCLPLHDTLLPLSHFIHEWERLPGVSLWVLRTIRSGYTLQFWEIPPPPRRGSTDGSKQRLQGFCSTAIAFLPPTERSDRGNTAVGHRTRVLQPKGDGGLRPILDLRRLNFSLYKGKFKMLTIKTIMSQIQKGDWFVTIDLKDAYFHIQVIQRHRRFLQFAFGGKGYQYKVLPFGLALAPRTFTKCMDAALAPLRLQGIRVLNYLDDWLILAHSRELVSRHRDIVLRHIHSLGLRMNAKKSVLLPSQRTLFLGVHLDSIQMQARLAPARISNFTACLARFKLGQHVSVGSCRRLLKASWQRPPLCCP